jgi:sporulation protein YunB
MKFNLRKRMIGWKVPPYKRRFVSSLITVGIFGILVVMIFYIVDFRIRPTLIQLAQVEARQIAAQTINEAIHADISPNIQYQNLIRITFNSAGKIILIQPNTGEINRIASEATLAVQRKLQKLPKTELRIPAGQVMGSRIMAGLGPQIPVKVLPVGFVESTINDRFEAAGINQVRHRIFVTVKATIKMVIPLISEEARVSTDIPLVEAIIVGEVPNVFVGNGGVILPDMKFKEPN